MLCSSFVCCLQKHNNTLTSHSPTTFNQGAMACVYKNPEEQIEARVKDLLSRMTLREKIGQMTQIERTVATSSAIRDLSIGTHTLTSFSTLSFLAGFELVGGWNEFERPR